MCARDRVVNEFHCFHQCWGLGLLNTHTHTHAHTHTHSKVEVLDHQTTHGLESSQSFETVSISCCGFAISSRHNVTTSSYGTELAMVTYRLHWPYSPDDEISKQYRDLCIHGNGEHLL